MPYKILVTGGAGYLGSILVPALLERGHSVTVIDSYMFQQSTLTEYCYLDAFNVLKADCRDECVMKELVPDADIIIPLAAIVGAPACTKDKTAARSTNTDAIRLITKLASKTQRILMPITNSGYGIGEKDKYCTEDSPLKPISFYGTTKVEAEKIILERENSISYRLATVFGLSPRMRIDLLVNDFVYRAVYDHFVVIFEGHFKRNYIHVRDVTKAFIHAIDNFERMKGNAYNVGLSEANISKLELCAKIKQYLPSFVYFESAVGEDADKRDYIVSNEKIERTGYKPDFSLDRGIQELIKGYRIIKNAKYGNV